MQLNKVNILIIIILFPLLLLSNLLICSLNKKIETFKVISSDTEIFKSNLIRPNSSLRKENLNKQEKDIIQDLKDSLTIKGQGIRPDYVPIANLNATTNDERQGKTRLGVRDSLLSQKEITSLLLKIDSLKREFFYKREQIYSFLIEINGDYILLENERPPEASSQKIVVNEKKLRVMEVELTKNVSLIPKAKLLLEFLEESLVRINILQQYAELYGELGPQEDIVFSKDKLLDDTKLMIELQQEIDSRLEGIKVIQREMKNIIIADRNLISAWMEETKVPMSIGKDFTQEEGMPSFDSQTFSSAPSIQLQNKVDLFQDGISLLQKRFSIKLNRKKYRNVRALQEKIDFLQSRKRFSVKYDTYEYEKILYTIDSVQYRLDSIMEIDRLNLTKKHIREIILLLEEVAASLE